MTTPKISIVVPVYNVERYLIKCVESLLSQTYTSYEILLVDDGSDDSSAHICDAYALNNDNIISLHKKNGGLSDARNYAMSYVSGEYVTFVDSDDYVHENYLNAMISCLPIGINDVDMVICSYKDVSEDIVASHHCDYNVKGINMSSKETLSEMCYEKYFGTSACAKLIRTNLVKQFPFPKGKLYEDLATMYKVIGHARRIVFLNQPLYYYVQRIGSIRNSKWNKQKWDVMEAANGLLNYIDNQYPELHKDAVQRYFFSANEVYVNAFSEKSYSRIIEPLRKKLKPLWHDVVNNPRISTKQRSRYWMMIHAPKIYRLIWNVWHKID